MASWLLVMCLSYGNYSDHCDTRGSITASYVTETHCRALTNFNVKTVIAWCYGPDGGLVVRSAPRS